MITKEQAREAVAAHTGYAAQWFKARKAPKGSIHDAVIYVHENGAPMLVDDQVWAVLATGEVTRLVPVGHPLHEPTPLD